MNITTGLKVRLANKFMVGTVTQIGCDKCIVKIETKEYECNKSELVEPLSKIAERVIKNAYRIITDANYRFFKDEDGKSLGHLLLGFTCGAIATILIALIK